MKLLGLYFVITVQPGQVDRSRTLCEQALRGGAQLIQLRDKCPYDGDTLPRAQALAALCAAYSVPFIVNDRIEVALAVRADGVHLGQQDTPLREARQALGPAKIIGATADTPEKARRAQEQGADYIGCGHLYPTTTKHKPNPPIGLEGLRAVVSAVSIPVFGIGGISWQRVLDVLLTGAAGIAVVSAISHSPDPFTSTQQLREQIDKWNVMQGN